MHRRRHVDLRQALPALSVVEPDLRAALQCQPHTLTVGHHASHAATAVRAHLKPVLWKREEFHYWPTYPPPPTHTHTHTHAHTSGPAAHILPTSFSSVIVLIIRTLFCEPHHSFPPTGTILVMGLLAVPRTNVWEDWGSQKLPVYIYFF